MWDNQRKRAEKNRYCLSDEEKGGRGVGHVAERYPGRDLLGFYG